MKRFDSQLYLVLLLSSSAIALSPTVAQSARPAIERLRSVPQAAPGWIAQQNDFASFFEEGRLRSENRLQLQRSPDPAIPVNPTSKFWQPVISQEINASFWMPPGILTQETVV